MLMLLLSVMDIKQAIAIIMGANIGTTVTNTLVSLAHSMNRKEFCRAFSGAVVSEAPAVLYGCQFCSGTGLFICVHKCFDRCL